jgi:2-polyprenyl-3-methyl-5-hydroxy-6-metoxy-1,4-benzoquinol methylase
VTDDRHTFTNDYSILNCSDCGHFFTGIDFEKTDFEALYSENYSNPQFKNQVSFYGRIRNLIFNSTLFGSWLKFDGDQYFLGRAPYERGLSLLDYGCFEGRQLKLFKRCGYTTKGLEINPEAAEIARLQGLDVTVSSLDEFADKNVGKFDIVIMSQVIEHLPDPFHALNQISKILKRDGKVRISCPNYKSFYRSIFLRNWSNWHVPFHLHHFDSNALIGLLQKANFEITYYGTITPSHGLAISLLNSFGCSGEANHKNPILIIPAMLSTLLFFKPISLLVNRLGRGDGLVLEARVKEILS